MAGLPAALALVPWSLLIEKAPTIASGAADLYAKVRGRQSLPPPAATENPVAALEARIADVEAEMQASARLVAALAEANAGLLAAVEQARRTTRVAIGVAVLALACAVTGLFL